MSGIAGIIHFDGAPVAPGLVERMTAAMAYRGPDGIRHWIRGSVALGQCMLCTTPESLEERQPLTNEDESLVLVMDGRVDNWETLRNDLLARGARLRDRTDTELVLRAYEAWGRDCLPRIDGDFAIVIWDARRREAFCARDRLGNKPFNYHWDGRTLAFASDAHAILRLPWIPERLNEGMVAEFLANEWLSLDETFWHGVLRLPQARRMTVDMRGPRVDEYWTPDLHANTHCTSDDAFAAHYRSLLGDTVRRMSRSAGPLGCEVSGGLDSSALLAVAEQLRRDARLLAPSLDAYTLAFADDSWANELVYARAVGAHLGIDVREIEPTRRSLDWYRRRAQTHRVFPGYPNGVMGLGIREEAAFRGSRALLVGVGGDEWLGGSRAYYADAVVGRHWRALFRCLAADRRDVGLMTSLWWLFRNGCVPLLPRQVRGAMRTIVAGPGSRARDRQTWLTPAMARELRERRVRFRAADAARTPRPSQYRQMQMLTSAFLAHARETEEALAAESGIELRRPFLARDLVEFAIAAPDSVRLRGRTDKYLHRLSMRDHLPEVVRTRETKAEFVITFRWHLRELESTLRDDIHRANSAWVVNGSVAQLPAKAFDPTQRNSPEWQLWTLFGCDALATARTRRGASAPVPECCTRVERSEERDAGREMPARHGTTYRAAAAQEALCQPDAEGVRQTARDDGSQVGADV